jgi:precorrin-6B methylase 2
MINKLENPARLLELAPADTLHKIGLSEGSIFCDVGAGTGVFTFPAASISNTTVYAVEISLNFRS